MQKWEYLFVGCQIHKDQTHARYVNGKQLKEWTDINIYEFSNRAGEKGWELVGMDLNGYYLAFKRPKQTEA